MTAPARVPTISHSQIVEWRRCQQRWFYRYGQRLVRKRTDRALHVGSWVHACLETHYGKGDWRIGHRPYVKKYNSLFDEEKTRLDRPPKAKGDGPFEPLPSQVKRIVQSYLWYKRNEKIKVLGVEVPFTIDVRDETGIVYRLHGVIDLIYEDEDGLIWVRDYKVPGDLPDEQAFHTMDPQLTIYLYGAKEALGVEAAGVEYEYIQSKAPTIPELRKKDGQPSEAAITTDYPTFLRFLQANGFDPRKYLDTLTPLAGSSPLLRRYRMPRSQVVTDRVLADADRTAREILGHSYTVRNITSQCGWCPYAALCRAELFDLDTSYMRKNDFEIEGRRPRQDKVLLTT